jgi:hypothetical protein
MRAQYCFCLGFISCCAVLFNEHPTSSKGLFSQLRIHQRDLTATLLRLLARLRPSAKLIAVTKKLNILF